MCEDTATFHLGKDEPDSNLVGKSLRFLPKVMFLWAVARPRFNKEGECTFDGKIGMWPFVDIVPAERASRNRVAWTPVMTNLNVTKAVYTSFLLNKIYPAIDAKFPRRTPAIYIQQDNASVHPKPDHEDVDACSR